MVYLFVVYITVSLLFLMPSVRSSVVYDICCSISVLNMILPSFWNIFFSEFLYKIKVVKTFIKFSVYLMRVGYISIFKTEILQ